MKRIGVIGTCQATGIGHGLFHLLDTAEILIFVISDVHRTDTVAETGKVLAGCDVVFTHYLPDDFGALSTDTLKKTLKNLFVIPSILFSGFHPDCIYIRRDGIPYKTPMDDYHSAIIAAGYSLGLPVERTVGLFNKLVFQKLGYFEEFAKAHALADQFMHAHGIDIAGEWASWMSPGPFMHTINHPKPHVMASVARIMAVQAGLVPEETRAPELIYDSMGMLPIWPVYPEIAEALGMRGNYIFKKPAFREPMGSHNLLSLKDFIQGCYESYAEIPREAFEADDVVKVRNILSTILGG